MKEVVDDRRDQLSVLAGAVQAVSLYTPGTVWTITNILQAASKSNVPTVRCVGDKPFKDTCTRVHIDQSQLVWLPVGGGVTFQGESSKANNSDVNNNINLKLTEDLEIGLYHSHNTSYSCANFNFIPTDKHLHANGTGQIMSKTNTNATTQTVMATQEKTLHIQNSVIEKTRKSLKPGTEILGDNFDLMVSPSSMTTDKQRKSWHWFLVLESVKRVLGTHLPNDKPKDNLLEKDLVNWLPSVKEMTKYEEDLQFHVVSVLIKYFPFLEKFKAIVPECIAHPYLAKTSQRSNVINCELIDCSENSSQGIIEIMQRLHTRYVPHKADKEILERSVLGGDAFTNDCAFAAQRHMINANTDFDKCAGVVHRPEGLHLIMNFIRVTS